MNWLKKWFMNIAIKQILKSKEVIKLIEKLRLLLAGRKTYFVAIVAIIGVLISFSGGDMSIVEAVKAIVEAILAMTIRAGIGTAK